MNIILLSGGSGKRLWPLSNDIRSKQFIQLFRTAAGTYESMVQRVYRQITEVSPDANVTIATSRSQASAIHNQLGDKVSVCVEPCRRDTFPAILLAAAYLHDEKIEQQKKVVFQAKERYDRALAELDELQKKRDEVRKKELMAAISSSKRTYEEIMAFLNVEEDQDGDG